MLGESGRIALGLEKLLHIPQGKTIIEADSNDNSLLLIENGLARLNSLDGEGTSIVLAILTPGCAVWQGLGRDDGLQISCVAVTDCGAYRANRSQLLAGPSNGWAVSLALAYVETTAQLLLQSLIDLHTLPASQRLQKLLAQLDRGPSTHRGPRLKSREIAEILGITPSHLSRLKRASSQNCKIASV